MVRVWFLRLATLRGSERRYFGVASPSGYTEGFSAWWFGDGFSVWLRCAALSVVVREWFLRLATLGDCQRSHLVMLVLFGYAEGF